MNFRTGIQLQKERDQIDYNSQLLLIGSCFSENINEKLTYFKFRTFCNPFGILFNPIVIEKLITNALNKKTFTEKDIFQLNERWHCFDAHSDLSSPDKEELLNNLNSFIGLTQQLLIRSTHVIITLGTAWVYRFIETNDLVGNCHKVPQKKFLKELLSIDEIVVSLENIIRLIKDFNPKTTMLFTVSPVRHLKDGFIENSQSKAHLLSAIHQVIENTTSGAQIHYFPSYEIMLDDLRDYRFYKRDMIHPNLTAIDYIWEKFQQAWLDDKTTSIMKEVDTIQKGLAHIPFNPKSEQHQQFLTNLQHKIQVLKRLHNILF